MKDNEYFNDHKKILSIIFILILIVQVFLLNKITNTSKVVNSNMNNLDNTKIEFQNNLINDTIRPQLRSELNNIRKGWILYLQSHQDTELLLKDNKQYIFSNNLCDHIIYNEKTMFKVKKANNYYDIYNKNNKQKIATNVRPQWNRQEIDKILNIIAMPMKPFGQNGTITIFDSYTGEVIADNSNNCSNVPEVLGKDGKRYITLDHKNPENKNPQMCKNTIMSQTIIRTDSDYNTKMVYMSKEGNNIIDANDFNKYPLGKYNRIFQEKIILPYESINVEGQEMQLTVIIGSEEKDIVKKYEKTFEKFESYEDILMNQIEHILYIPITSIFLSLFIIVISMFSIKKNAFLFNKIKKGDSQENKS